MTIKITREMYADWCHPDGYRDFNGSPEYAAITHDLVEMIDGDLVLKRWEGEGITSFALVASDTLSDRPRRRFCPCWRMDLENMPQRHGMVDPEFSLDEMAMAEELMAGQRG